ncbi:MAG TPA: PIN domain-containing protein [Kineosporiaceae bacterium]|nr:PIN domain-containing protein [Kineosporiaceae bacterium]
MRVVADSHAALWYANGSQRLSGPARRALANAEDELGGIVVSVATLIDLWYVTQTTQGVSAGDLGRLRVGMLSSPAVELYPVDVAVSDAYIGIDRGLISDPWDRLIVATALALEVPLVTRDGAIRASGLVETLW